MGVELLNVYSLLSAAGYVLFADKNRAKIVFFLHNLLINRKKHLSDIPLYPYI